MVRRHHPYPRRRAHPRRPPVSNFARQAEIRLLDGDSAQHSLLDKENNADSSYRERYYGGDDGLSKAEYLAKINPSFSYQQGHEILADHEMSMDFSGRSTNDGLAALNQLWRYVAVPFPNTILRPIVTQDDCLEAAVIMHGDSVTRYDDNLVVGSECVIRDVPLSPDVPPSRPRACGPGRAKRVLTDAPLAQLGACPLRLLGTVG